MTGRPLPVAPPMAKPNDRRRSRRDVGFRPSGKLEQIAWLGRDRTFAWCSDLTPRVRSEKRSQGSCRTDQSRRPGCGRAGQSSKRRPLRGGQLRPPNSSLEPAPGDPHTVHDHRALARNGHTAGAELRWLTATRHQRRRRLIEEVAEHSQAALVRASLQPWLVSSAGASSVPAHYRRAQ